MTAKLYGVGVGPGDPELLTLKAARVLQSVPVIAYPKPDNADSLVRRIAHEHIPSGQTEIAIVTPMTPGNYPANDVYDHYAAEIAAHLKAGRSVAVLCEGDPFLFGSFMYIYQRLAEHFPTEVIPGVSSLGAVAAAAGRPLVSRNQVLSLIPAPLPDDVLKARIMEADCAAIFKVGRHLPRISHLLNEMGLMDGAVYVEHATMDSERVLPLTEVKAGDVPYFSMILLERMNGNFS